MFAWVLLSNPGFADSPSLASSSAGQPFYASAMTNFQTLGEKEPLAWKKANDTVREIGGWRSYAREVYQASQSKLPVASKTQTAGVADITTGLTSVTRSEEMAIEPESVTGKDAGADSGNSPEHFRQDTASPAQPAAITLTYLPAMSSYMYYEDILVGNWLSANERVREIGGWRAYAKETYQAGQRQSQEKFSTGTTE